MLKIPKKATVPSKSSSFGVADVARDKRPELSELLQKEIEDYRD